MRFSASVPTISEKETIIIPISMNQPLESGEHLAAILKAVEDNGYKERTTILICDYLNRYNCGEEEACKLGHEFLKDHKNIINGFQVVRWKEFLDSRQSIGFNTHVKRVEEAAKEGTLFYGKMKKTWQKCSSAFSLANSIKYQIEEYAVILCMNEYDHMLYPKRITDGMAYLYNAIEGKKPVYHHIKVSELKKREEQSVAPLLKGLSLFKNTKETAHVHIAFRVLLDQVAALLDTSELSPESKKVFAKEMEKLLMSHSLLTDFEADLNDKVRTEGNRV